MENQIEQKFTVKIEFIGGREPIEFGELTKEQMETIRSWFSRVNPILEVPVGKTLVMLDREKITHIVINGN